MHWVVFQINRLQISCNEWKSIINYKTFLRYVLSHYNRYNYWKKRKTNEKRVSTALLVRVLHVSLQDLGASVGLDAVLNVVTGESEKRLGPYHAQHQVESGQPGQQPLPGQRVGENRRSEAAGQHQLFRVLERRSAGPVVLATCMKNFKILSQ